MYISILYPLVYVYFSAFQPKDKQRMEVFISEISKILTQYNIAGMLNTFQLEFLDKLCLVMVMNPIWAVL